MPPKGFVKAKGKAKGKAKAKGKGKGKGKARAALQNTASSQYRVIDGEKYVGAILDLAAEVAAEGPLSKRDAEKLWASVKDGPGLTATEKRSFEYVMQEHAFSDEAATYMRELLANIVFMPEEPTSTALVVAKPKGKGGASAMRKKVIEDLGEKSVEDALLEAKSVLQKQDAMIEEAAALEVAQEKQVTEAQQEFDKAKADVAEAIDKEKESANKYRELKGKRQEFTKKNESQRMELLEAQKKLAMLEVLALNHARMAELEAKRKAATEAAEAAKRHLLEQRQKEKEALEATRQALAEARASRKRANAAEDAPADKRPAIEASAQGAADIE
mmetsp:Transcript_68108/g.190189  ORF Transcript_68108/g.190189 Transcript_68108/m.190189 type:complete len:331 (+) Transcript_68108:118-1110(+)